jgi:hypothetical protein
MTDIKSGDLISTLDYRGKKVYSIVLACYNRYGFKEIQILTAGKVKAIVYDGSLSSIIVEQEVKNESRTTTKTL